MKNLFVSALVAAALVCPMANAHEVEQAPPAEAIHQVEADHALKAQPKKHVVKKRKGKKKCHGKKHHAKKHHHKNHAHHGHAHKTVAEEKVEQETEKTNR